MILLQQTWKRYIKCSYAYQLARKVESLKKEIKDWKKSCYNNPSHNIDILKQDLIIKQNHLINKPSYYVVWKQKMVKDSTGKIFH